MATNSSLLFIGLLLFWMLSSVQSQCTFYEPGPIAIEQDKVIGNIEIDQIIEISFNFTLNTPCNGYCHFFAIGTRYPLLYTVSGHMEISFDIFGWIPATSNVTFLNDGNSHSLFVKISYNQLIMEIDGTRVLDFPHRIWSNSLGTTQQITTVWANPSGHQYFHDGTIENLCVLSTPPTPSPTDSTSPTSAPTRNPTLEPTTYPTSDPTSAPTSGPTTLTPSVSPSTYSPSINPTTTPPTQNPVTAQPSLNPTTSESSATPSNMTLASSLAPTTAEEGQVLTAEEPGLINRVGYMLSDCFSIKNNTDTLATKIVYKSQENENIFNVENVSGMQMIIGILIILVCCCGPVLIGLSMCYCYFHWRERKGRRQPVVRKKNPDITDINEEDGRDKDEEDHLSKSGLSAQDSLKLKPGLSDNYSFTPSKVTPKMIDIQMRNKYKLSSPKSDKSLHIEGLRKNNNNKMKLDANVDSMRSNDSEAMYRDVKATKNGNEMNKTTRTHLELSVMSSDDRNDLQNMLEVILDQPSVNQQEQTKGTHSSGLYKDDSGGV